MPLRISFFNSVPLYSIPLLIVLQYPMPSPSTPSLLFYWFISSQFLLSFSLYLASLLYMLHLLHSVFIRHRSLNLELSPFLILNMCCWCLMLATGLPHIIFMIFRVFVTILSFNDGPEDIPLSPTTLVFWSQIWTQCFIPAITFSVLFLTLDRLFCIATPIWYTARRRDALFWITIGSLATLYLAIFYSFLLELPLPEFTDCITFACTIKKTGSKGFIISKILGGMLIILSGLALLDKIKKRQKALAAASGGGAASHAGAMSNRANRVAVLMIASELLLNFVPQLIVLIVYETTGIVPSAHIGPHNMVLSALDALISTLTFRWIFRKKLISAAEKKKQQQQQKSQETPVNQNQMVGTTSKPRTSRGAEIMVRAGGAEERVQIEGGMPPGTAQASGGWMAEG